MYMQLKNLIFSFFCPLKSFRIMFKCLSDSSLFAWQILIFIIWEKIYFKLGKKCKISQGETTEHRWHFGPKKITDVAYSTSLKVTNSYKIISKWPPSTPLRKSCHQHCNIVPICKLFQFICSGNVTLFWVMCKWKRAKGRNQFKYSHQYLVSILKNQIPTLPTF